MRLWHIILAVVVLAAVMAAARDDVGRVALVVFFFGLGEFLLGTAALVTLFKTVGAIGQARHIGAYLGAVCATILVLVVASLVMNALLWVGVGLVQNVVSSPP